MPPESPTNPVPLKVEYIAPDNIAIKGNNPKQSKNIHNTRFLLLHLHLILISLLTPF